MSSWPPPVHTYEYPLDNPQDIGLPYWPPPDPNRDYVTYADHDDWGDHGPWVAMDVLGSHGTRFKTLPEALLHIHKVHFNGHNS